MGRIEKTVFISYRRTNLPWALAIYLTPSALEHCKEPSDWFRREIEAAMDEKRNIVPLMLESFDFGSPLVVQALTGKLASLNKYNGLSVPSEYFLEAMERLRQRYLKVSLEELHLHPLSEDAKDNAESQKAAANKAKAVNAIQLKLQERFESGYAHGTLRIPILGPIAAGLPLPELLNLDASFMTNNQANAVDIARSLLPAMEKGDDLFALEVKGDSMIDAMINDGDIVVIKSASTARNGEMVVI